MKTLAVGMGMLSLMCFAEAQDAKQPPKPGKEHGLLKQFEGRWDAVTTSTHEGKSMECKGTESDRIAHDGFWMVMEYIGQVDGKPFSGQGTMGYDPMKKKYVMTWIGSMAPYPMWGQGDADATGKIFTFNSEGFCPELGKEATFRTVFEFQDANHRTLTFYRAGKSGSEEKTGVISYTRQS